jgi:predicted NBD/HSP70 family sugar kinase
MADQTSSIQDTNRRLILDRVRRRPGTSRAEVARRPGLAKATVSELCGELIAAGPLREVGEEERQGRGRRRAQLMLNPGHRLAIGLNLTGSQCVGVLADLGGAPLRTVRCLLADPAPEAVAETLAGLARQLAAEADPGRVLGVGVPGAVDAVGQTALEASGVGWADVSLGPLLAARLGLPVTLVRGQNAVALGEYWSGAGRGAGSLLYVSIGLGIGAGLVLQGRLYPGAAGVAGDIAHVSVVAGGARCRCGGQGCLETVAGYSPLAARLRARLIQGGSSVLVERVAGVLERITGETVLEAAAQGAGLAVEVVQKVAGYVGSTLAGAIYLLNPDRIVVGGRMAELGAAFTLPLQCAVQERTLRRPLSALQLVPGVLGERAAAVGAATLVCDALLAPGGMASALEQSVG